MASGLGAGAGADMLQDILRQKFTEAITRQKLAEDARQANMVNAVQQRQLGQGDQRINLDQQKFGEDTRQFDVSSGQRDRTIKLDEGMQPLRIKQIGAQVADLERKPQAEQEQRTFTTQRDQAQHGYQMQEIGAQGANAMRVANVRHPDPAAGASAQQANEVADTIALIDQISSDPAMSANVGPIDSRGLGFARDPGGNARFTALHDQLVGKMSLAQAGKLKGQGQISDKERAMLAAAATALNRGLQDPDYKNELGKIRNQFVTMQGGGVAPAATAPPAGGAHKVGDTKTFPNGRKAVWDGTGWVAQ